MWIVTRMHTKFGTNMGDCDVTLDKDISGFLYVYKTKKAAMKMATDESQVIEITVPGDRS